MVKINKVIRTYINVLDPFVPSMAVYNSLKSSIFYKGGIWLVPRWQPAPHEEFLRPERIIRVDSLSHDKGFLADQDFVAFLRIRGALPINVLRGEVSYDRGTQYEVVESPDLISPRTPQEFYRENLPDEWRDN